MKKFVILFLILLVILLGYFVYDYFAYTNVFVKFDDLEPFEKQMKVYFKGFKVGKTTKIFPNKEFTNTYLKMRLKTGDIVFPSNIKVNIRKKKSGGYVDILYPDDPSLSKLKNNDEIQGLITKDISSLLESENIEDIVDDAGNLIESANTAVKSLNDIFVQIEGLIEDNRPNINLAIKNLVVTTSNLAKISENLEKSLDKNDISSSVSNIEETTKNIKEITQQVNNTSIPIVNGILCQTHSTAKNASEITFGVKKTLKKHMGLSRLFFGRPIDKDCE